MNARGHAEKAVLGAVLADPRQLAGLAEWLSPDDFWAPQHADLYRAMLILDERGGTPDLDATPSEERAQRITTYVLDLVRHVTAGGTELDAPYVHTLMQACPRAEHAPYYGRMVVEADMHRTIIENATRLAQLVHEHQESPFGLEHLFVHTAAFRQVLDHLADRWGLTDDGLARPNAEDAIDPRTATFADQLAPELDASPSPERQAAAAEREDTLLACVLRSPDQLDGLRTYLDPDDFAAPGRGALYQAALDVHTRGDPLDPVTLIWEAQKRDIPAAETRDGEASPIAPLDGDDLMRLYGDGLPAETARYYARQIIEAAILTNTTEAARDLKSLASSPRLSATDLIPAAANRIDRLNRQEDRWNSMHGGGDVEARDTEDAHRGQSR